MSSAARTPLKPTVAAASHVEAVDMRAVEGKLRVELQARQEQPAIVEERRTELNALAYRGQQRDRGEIPEQDLQQQGDVAKHLDVRRRRAAYQGPGREPPERDEKRDERAEQARQRDHEQRVERGDDDRVEVRRRRSERDEALSDLESCLRAQEVEARGQAQRARIRLKIESAPPDQPADDDQENGLRDITGQSLFENGPGQPWLRSRRHT